MSYKTVKKSWTHGINTSEIYVQIPKKIMLIGKKIILQIFKLYPLFYLIKPRTQTHQDTHLPICQTHKHNFQVLLGQDR